ncbi:histidine phosphatase family protein [Pacificimonas sp. WHA3]|uniref:Histidine phosphatase family protein n=1 Tax=Pacificimonas pallii TaxID=2827236 RepID=A0ABS6SG42_9SPHN|nr:histidine phosphatase family protein [Pacificimonas pallii]MBV7257390.1 histidine phosphatase family protein [Pacificimonas pallii]
MRTPPARTAPLYLARHAETVFNFGARMQGHMGHTPLTRRGIEQADAMGAALHGILGAKPDIDLWSSKAGRTLQTCAVVAEHLERDYFDIRQDERLLEIDVGAWEGRRYQDIVEEAGVPIVDAERRLFSVPPPQGEWYPDIRARLDDWLAELDPVRPALVVSHGITARVLRGALVGGDPIEPGCVPIAGDAPQGTVFRIENGAETSIHMGMGSADGRDAPKGY